MAAKSGRNSVVQILIGAGADVNATGNNAALYKSTSLHMAAQNGHAGVVRLLAETGATLDVSFKEESGDTWDAHEAALMNDHDKLAEALEAWTANPSLIRTAVKRGQRYRVTKRLVVRESYDLSSRQVSSLDGGDIIVALDSRQIATRSKEVGGEDVLQTRVRFETGWISLNARDGGALLRLVNDEDGDMSSPWKAIQASVNGTNSMPTDNDIFSSLGAFGFTSEESGAPRRIRRQTEAVMPGLRDDQQRLGHGSTMASFGQSGHSSRDAAASSPPQVSPEVVGECSIFLHRSLHLLVFSRLKVTRVSDFDPTPPSSAPFDCDRSSATAL